VSSGQSIRDALAHTMRKGFRAGTDRCVDPAETLARLQPLLPRLGITRVANVTGLDRIGIAVVMACRPNSRSLAVSQGKGLTLAAAKASALMETIESWHAERVAGPLRLCSYDELRAEATVIDVTRLPRTKASLFHPRYPILWIEGWDILNDERVWVPYEVVHTNYTLPHPTGHGCFAPSSNGLASGNDLTEAISHAICELIERDAVAIWSELPMDAQDALRLDPAFVKDAGCRSVLDAFDAARIETSIWDVTSDVGLPVFFCVIVEDGRNVLHPLHSAAGMGCHPMREIALLRAITEAAQSRLTIIAGSRDDCFREDYELARSADVLVRDRRLGQRAGGRSLADAPTFDHATFNEDVATECDLLRRGGFERAVVFDLTHPDVGVAVVRVVIPGLEGPIDLDGYRPGPRALARVAAEGLP
jgi:ribosomal protein S12 methylthiotransferase accessory factor